MTIGAAALATLVAAALPDEDLDVADVETCCFGPETEVIGDEQGAAVLTIKHFDDVAVGWLVLLAVHPSEQRSGHGRRIMHRVIDRARAAGAIDVHLGNAIPRYVWPGVDFRFTAALSLFESLGFEPYGAAFNMTIPGSFRADVPAGVIVARETGAGATEFANAHYPHWVDEVSRATARGGCFAARADDATIGFACHSVNRRGWVGPMATDPERQHGGVGNALLAAVCADLEANGLADGEISWVGPIGFYAKAGARVSRVFRNARLSL